MTEYNHRLREMIQVKESLNSIASKTKDVFDAKMRATVKGLLDDHYALEGLTVEDAEGMRAHMRVVEVSGQIADKLLGVDGSNFRQTHRSKMDWDYDRPRRVLEYVKKIADIIPAEYLTKLISDSQRLTAEELISRYEAVKGEAKQSDYSGQPSGIDPKAFRIIARIRRKQGNN
ncbi:MAG: hypothetical protein ABSA11_05505 [Candidatus Bathyarchaeia archaeon]